MKTKAHPNCFLIIVALAFCLLSFFAENGSSQSTGNVQVTTANGLHRVTFDTLEGR